MSSLAIRFKGKMDQEPDNDTGSCSGVIIPHIANVQA
jgi:hypothetical protein